VFNVLLQILDDGRVTDAQGRTVNFKNTVIIMTSNIGSQHLLEGVTPSGQITNDARSAVLAELRRAFRPEFLNRVDDTVLFKPLQLDEIAKIVELQASDLERRLAERRIGLEITPEAARHIAETAFDPVYGARPLKRYIQHEIETRVGRAIIAGELTDGGRVLVTLDEAGGLAVRPEPARQSA
jgi:ATP-dependent Clp protease ATP-binding subunit ClpB